MKVKLNHRQKALLGVAIVKYDALAKGTQSNLTSLNLPTMAVDTARGCIEVINERFGTTGEDETEGKYEIDLQEDLRMVIRDALSFALTKYVKAENNQTELLIGTAETEQTMGEIRALQRKFSDQGELEMWNAADSATRPSEEGILELRTAAKTGIDE